MKILLVHKRFYPHLGGVETYLYSLAKEFIKKGHSVSVLSCKEGEELKTRETYQDIKIYRYNMPILDKNKIWKWPIKHQIAAEEFIHKNFEQEDFDIILCRFAIFIMPCVEFFGKEKVIYIAPSTYSVFCDILNIKFGNQKKTFGIFKKIEKGDLRDVKIITLSKAVKKQVLNLKLAKKVSVIRPGINLERFKVGRDKKDLVLYMGRLTQEKNPEAGIRLSKLINKGKILIVGGGNNLEDLKEYAKSKGNTKRLIFKGWQKEPERFFRKASVFILTSLYEGFGHVILEAFASGLPVIAFKPDGKKIITASDEIIEDGKTGFLVKNEEEMAEKIELLLSDEKLRKKIGKAARKEAEKYSWKKAAEEILKFAKKQK